VHGKTAYLAGVGQEIRISETVLGEDEGFESGRTVVFDSPRVVDYRASVPDIAKYLLKLMSEPALRSSMGEAARKRVVELFDYRAVARKFVEIISRRLGID
jgi:glycosyltransferase involved in cell wall biosynthesis